LTATSLQQFHQVMASTAQRTHGIDRFDKAIDSLAH
jgi:hypothetical protein